MTDKPRGQGFFILSFLNTGSGLYVGHAARVRLFVDALCGAIRDGACGHPWRRWPDAYAKGNAVYRR